jgi:hypothetical protein
MLNVITTACAWNLSRLNASGALLLGENPAAARRTAEQLVHDSSGTLAFRSTLALGYLRTGNPAAALHLYDGIDVGWDTAPPSAQAVHLAALIGNGETAQAKAQAASIPAAVLKPEERALIAPARSLPSERSK